MKKTKRLLMMALALVICFGALTAGLTAGALTFVDVPEDAWYAADVSAMVEADIIHGRGEGRYAPDDNVTFAETVTLAAMVHSRLSGGEIPAQAQGEWYERYYDYVTAAGGFPDTDSCAPSERVSRELFARVMSGVLALFSESELGRNTVEDGAIPDVSDHVNYPHVYALYRAGILAGSDAIGSFRPGSNIKRSEVAAIIHRIVDPARRVGVTLRVPELPEPADDGDRTGFAPLGWSWISAYPGMSEAVFTPGKYVRSDGCAVLYIDMIPGAYEFSYKLCAATDTPGRTSLYVPDAQSGGFARADMDGSRALDSGNGLEFQDNGSHFVTVLSSAGDEQWGSAVSPDGVYRLVREKR